MQLPAPDCSAGRRASAHGLPPPCWVEVSRVRSLHTPCRAELSGAAILPEEVWSEGPGARPLPAASCEPVKLA